MRRRRAVFLDRDGVLNQAVIMDGRPRPPADAASMILTPGAASLMMDLREIGFFLICVTNQPDVARGTRTMESVMAMNDRVRFELTLDDVLTCPHDDADDCACRKPKPGLILEAADRWSLDLPSSWMVGDRAGDVGAGQAAGCRTILIDLGHDEPKPVPPADYTCGSLLEAVTIIRRVTFHDENPDRFAGKIVR
jgi:D-glycero-D-manno-heptose 1,7-bisphosphate phosphatase